MSENLQSLIDEAAKLGGEIDELLDGEGQAAGPPPDAPAHLDDVARAKWIEIVGEIDNRDQGVLDLLQLYCCTWSRWREAEAKVVELGTIIKSPSGYPVQCPYLAIANRAAADLLKIGKRLGLADPRR
jgi:P27 family predicted phage terminase small subunit